MFGLIAAFTMPQFASGGVPELTSKVLAGGGGTSVSADQRFHLRGTLGQTDGTGIMRSPDDRFTVQPGFWHGILIVPTPGAPQLSIRAGVPGTIVIAWPKETTGFVLEETSNLMTRDWKAMLVRIVDTDMEHTVTVSAGGTRCFRLRKP